jgi:hypothetical protein
MSYLRFPEELKNFFPIKRSAKSKQRPNLSDLKAEVPLLKKEEINQ